MPKDRETEYSEDEFSLDAILAEFGSGKTEEARREEPPAAPFDAPTEASPTRGGAAPPRVGWGGRATIFAPPIHSAPPPVRRERGRFQV